MRPWSSRFAVYSPASIGATSSAPCGVAMMNDEPDWYRYKCMADGPYPSNDLDRQTRIHAILTLALMENPKLTPGGPMRDIGLAAIQASRILNGGDL